MHEMNNVKEDPFCKGARSVSFTPCRRKGTTLRIGHQFPEMPNLI
jgi:hypothetical protein